MSMKLQVKQQYFVWGSIGMGVFVMLYGREKLNVTKCNFQNLISGEQ